MTTDYRSIAVALADEGYTSFEELAIMCLNYMSLDDVEDMLRSNDYDEMVDLVN